MIAIFYNTFEQYYRLVLMSLDHRCFSTFL
nr:MAG TPA: hypothetical protein [Caudoviricetes sp.]